MREFLRSRGRPPSGDGTHRLVAAPRISVVTPSFRQAAFLEQCLRSVLDQGYPDVELIVVDGGGSDETLEIIRRYDSRLAWWVSEKDEGQSDAINKGLRHATGDLVSWLNSDDFLFHGALAAVSDAYRADPTGSFYFGDGSRVDAGGREISGFFPGGLVAFNLDALVFGLNCILQPSTFMNRAVLLSCPVQKEHAAGAESGEPLPVEWVDTALHYGMDTDLWIRLARRAPPVAVPARLSASREYGATKTSTGSFGRIEELRRIAERHSGAPMTPGVLLYFLDTLHRLSREREDLFPPWFRGDIEKFWGAAGSLLARHGARPDGFPAEKDANGRGPGSRG
jgi:glycosyltransferase involved in cell wall biosynthesis